MIGWLTFCTNPISRKILILEIYEQKLSTNQITRFFKLLYLLNRSTICYIFCMKIEHHKTFKVMLSRLWKMPICPQKGQKWAKQLEKVNFFVYFSKLAYQIYLIFCMKLGVHKCSKVTEPDFSGKILISSKMEKSGPKIGFLDFCAKLCHYFLLEMT